MKFYFVAIIIIWLTLTDAFFFGFRNNARRRRNRHKQLKITAKQRRVAQEAGCIQDNYSLIECMATSHLYQELYVGPFCMQSSPVQHCPKFQHFATFKNTLISIVGTMIVGAMIMVSCMTVISCAITCCVFSSPEAFRRQYRN